MSQQARWLRRGWHAGARLRALRSDLIDSTIAVHHGHVAKRTGDGVVGLPKRFNLFSAMSWIKALDWQIIFPWTGSQYLRRRTPAIWS
jgi:hypothetical protein